MWPIFGAFAGHQADFLIQFKMEHALVLSSTKPCTPQSINGSEFIYKLSMENLKSVSFLFVALVH
jgi:hypothetical protein